MSQESIVAILTALLSSPFFIAAAMAAFQWLLHKLPANRQSQIEKVASVVATAVEQTSKNLPGTNDKKKAEALKLASAMLKDLGINATPDTLSAYIEAAVSALPATVKGVILAAGGIEIRPW